MNNISKKYKWSIYRSIRNGAVIGILYSFYSVYQGASLILSYQDVDDPDVLTFFDLMDTKSDFFYNV
jgi:hypothetical protein